MCGILSVINLSGKTTGAQLIDATRVITHRGPDDEGFLTWVPGEDPAIWAGDDTATSTENHWKYKKIKPEAGFKVGFGHRRLSILDLSSAGHQPMMYKKAGLAITYNGEIYNYLEVKAELERIGHWFISTCDTEVILHAWAEWGPKCLDRFNGMFAFVMLDYNKKEFYAVRDRFGVKPLYYYMSADAIYFASEIKQIRTSPDYKFSINESIARQFLATGAVDHTEDTFDTQIKHVPCGHYIQIDVSTDGRKFEKKKWYTLKPSKWKGSYDEAVVQFRNLLTDAVNLRLRSDVKVGSCLSGGLDSSSIVCIAADQLKKKGEYAGQETVTACYDNAKYDEWNFAQEVIKKTNAHAHRVFPDFKQLQKEIDSFLWHQDEPVGSTSAFSQWAVFKATNEAGLKVMIDGQGADEQLAGYSGNTLPLYAGLLRKARLYSLYDEARDFKKTNGAWPYGFLLGAMQLNFGKGFTNILPQKLRLKQQTIDWFNIPEPANIYHTPARTLQENLLRQLYQEPLPALLRYEDHNSMAWSVESRTPFLDYRLLEFTIGLPEQYIYKRGVRKVLLRDAMRGILPLAIENRKDKMGFVTPEEVWLKGEGKDWFTDGVEQTLRLLPSMFNATKVRTFCADIIEGKIPFDFTIWRILSFGKWYASMIQLPSTNK